AGGPWRQDHHRCRFLLGLFELLAFQPRVPEMLRRLAFRHSQGTWRRISGAWLTSGADLTFAACQPRTRKANVKSKAPLESIFASGPLIPTFAQSCSLQGDANDVIGPLDSTRGIVRAGAGPRLGAALVDGNIAIIDALLVRPFWAKPLFARKHRSARLRRGSGSSAAIALSVLGPSAGRKRDEQQCACESSA